GVRASHRPATPRLHRLLECHVLYPGLVPSRAVHGRDLVDVSHQLGLHVLNTGSFTFVRRTGRPSCTALDSLASEGARYDWTTEADPWGSGHLPIVITPVGGKILRTDAVLYSRMSRVPKNHSVPDLRHLNLRVARRRAERSLPATRQPPQTAELAELTRGCSKAWRLLWSLVIGTAARQPILAVAIRLGITEQEPAVRLANRFTALSVAQPAAITTTPAPKPPQGHHPAWTACQISAKLWVMICGDEDKNHRFVWFVKPHY
ncbi:hypothetical protein MTO96_030432, partial [Rhipicephalus appendiculatus]